MSGVQSVERAFAILRVLARGPIGVTEIADRAELPKSTVSRLLAALEAEGAVEQLESGGGYSIGEALAVLGASGSPSAGLRSIVRPFIEDLALVTGGSAGFTVREGDTAYWADNVEHGDELVTVTDQTGQSFPLHTIVSGLAMLATLTPAALERYLSTPRHTAEGDVIDIDGLRERLARVEADRVVVSKEEVDAGVNAFAVPFRGSDGEWVGALYVQGPSFRFPADGDAAHIVELVCETAAQLSERIANS